MMSDLQLVQLLNNFRTLQIGDILRIPVKSTFPDIGLYTHDTVSRLTYYMVFLLCKLEVMNFLL